MQGVFFLVRAEDFLVVVNFRGLGRRVINSEKMLHADATAQSPLIQPILSTRYSTVSTHPED